MGGLTANILKFYDTIMVAEISLNGVVFIIYIPGARGIRRNITRNDDIEISSLRVKFRRIIRAEGV